MCPPLPITDLYVLANIKELGTFNGPVFLMILSLILCYGTTPRWRYLQNLKLAAVITVVVQQTCVIEAAVQFTG
ncbi:MULTISPECIES: hypothetical protein [Photorhabdus]|uniref:Uncharacterized protein n=1 Tax=Photorhabdus bodei TaxID=2029681 RepID=A0AAW6BND0_9GAMM|nr:MULTISPECIES: hypothetical protein [Photorhabdus]MDB6374663.1 hypothetical protein [Photorhabdus bodei]